MVKLLTVFAVHCVSVCVLSTERGSEHDTDEHGDMHTSLTNVAPT